MNAEGIQASYQYNGLGYRTGKGIRESLPDPEKQVRYTIDLTRQYHNLLEKEEGGETLSFLWDGNVAGMRSTGGRGAGGKHPGTPEYYLEDDLGSPVRLLNGDGELTESYGYDEFGRDLYGNQGVTQPFGYTGYQYDRVSGTCFAQAREYMPHAGRFAGQDIVKGVIVLPLSLNHYIYCWNRPLDLVDLNGLWASWSDIKNAITGVGDSIASGFSKAADSVENFYEDHKKAIDTTLKITGAVVVTGLLVVGTVCTGGALGVICAGALAGGITGMGVDIMMQTAGYFASGRKENFNWDQVLISGLAGASSGALSYATANPALLFTGNAAINIAAYCATQNVRDEEITTEGVAISGVLGGFAGLLSGSSRASTDITQMALERSWFSSVPVMARQEMFSYMADSVIRSTGRNLLAEWGRYIATEKAISFFEKVFCDE